MAVVDPNINYTEVSLGDEETEKVLGVHWKARGDTLTFPMSHLDDVEFTRLGLLSKVGSLFDPQGMVAPMIAMAKHKLRELSRKRSPEASTSWMHVNDKR